MADNILTLKNVTKRYPGVVALSDVSIEVRRGEVLALIGENGAGKSTMIKTITGAIQPDEGVITFEGQGYKALNPTLTRDLGIAAIYQEFTLAPTLTVAENIFMGQKVNEGPVRNTKLLFEKAQQVLDRFGVDINPRSLVRDLTVAYKQLVEIAKAIAKNAKLIIMDEPTAPLTDDEVDILMKIVHELKAEGISIIFISHRLDELYRVADRVTVMRDGEVIITKEVSALSKADLIYYMVGRELKESFPARSITYGDVALEVKGLTGNGVAPISFSVRRGEVVGLAGLVGAGRTETMRLIFGADHKARGKVFIDGREVSIASPRRAVAHRIGFVTENRKEEGLFLSLPVRNNIVAVAIDKIKSFHILNFNREKEISDKYVRDLQIATPSINQRVVFLSGGNQQKVVLAKWLLSDSQGMILDEPTRGIDVGAKREIYEIINQLAAQGKAIIVVSSEMEEIMGISDRILVMHEGEISGEVKKEDFSQSTITEYAVGGA